MPTLSDATNVSNTALTVLSQKGFQVWYDEHTRTYCAERDGWDFMADSPCALLGLVAIFEHVKPEGHREYWWQIDGLDYNRIARSPRPYQSVLT